MKYLLLLMSMLLAVAGQFFLKKGISGSTLAPNLDSVVKTLLIPSVLIGFVAYGLSSIVWLFVLQKFPLSIAYPSLALTYILVVLLGATVFGESINLTKIMGVIIIFLGVVLVNK